MNNPELYFLVLVFLFVGGVYLIIQLLLRKYQEERNFSLKSKNSETILPLRIQAYERMALFLERISPNYLFLRLYEKAVSVGDFQQLLLKEVREEYYHNLAQQVYMSAELWDKINKAMNELMVLINTSAAELNPELPAINLSKKVLEKVIQEEKNPTAEAMAMLKREVQKLY